MLLAFWSQTPYFRYLLQLLPVGFVATEDIRCQLLFALLLPGLPSEPFIVVMELLSKLEVVRLSDPRLVWLIIFESGS